MYYLGLAMVIIGVIYVYMLLIRPPWLLKNFKVKAMIKMMGVKGFWIFFVVWTILFLVVGSWLMSM